MSIRIIISCVIAALLFTGTAGYVSERAESKGVAVTPVQTAETVTDAAVEELTPEEAVSIAMDHAGLVESDTTDLWVVRDSDDWIPHYDVSFRSGDWEYEYEIGAVNGVVLDWDRDHEPVEGKSAEVTSAPAVSQSPAPVESEPVVTELTGEEAVAVALLHAGLNDSQVSRVEREFDWDDGVPTWDVSFRAGFWEYDYEIHAVTGAILKYDKDFDD